MQNIKMSFYKKFLEQVETWISLAFCSCFCPKYMHFLFISTIFVSQFSLFLCQGKCVLTVQLCDEALSEGERGEVQFFLSFTGSAQRHLTSTLKVNHATLQAVCPGERTTGPLDLWLYSQLHPNRDPLTFFLLKMTFLLHTHPKTELIEVGFMRELWG